MSLPQFNYLYEKAIDRKEEELRWQAALQGVDITKSNKKPNSESDTATPDSRPGFTFGSPDDYAHLSKEERDKITQEMMRKHKAWKEKSILKERS